MFLSWTASEKVSASKSDQWSLSRFLEFTQICPSARRAADFGESATLTLLRSSRRHLALWQQNISFGGRTSLAVPVSLTGWFAELWEVQLTCVSSYFQRRQKQCSRSWVFVFEQQCSRAADQSSKARRQLRIKQQCKKEIRLGECESCSEMKMRKAEMDNTGTTLQSKPSPPRSCNTCRLQVFH